MKIFAVIHNYGQMDDTSPMGEGRPDWYEMPDSSILRSGNPMFIPDFDTEFRAFPSLCLRIGRLGKSIASRFAGRYFDGWTAAVAIVGINRLKDLRDSQMPWTRAVAFDRSCLLGNLQPIDTLKEYRPLSIECSSEKSDYDPTRLRNSPDSILEAISAENTVKNGDLILAGLTPDGILLERGSELKIKNNNINLIDINIK